MDPMARQTHRSTTATDARPDDRPAPQPAQPSARHDGELVWRDMDGDQLTVRRHGDGQLRLETRRQNVPGDPVLLERDQVLALYHTLGDHLMATAPDADPEDSPGCVEQADELAEWERELLGDTSPKGLLQAALNAAGIDASAGQADHELVDRVLDTWQGRALLYGMESVAAAATARQLRDQQPETITAEAERAVYGDRHDDYGHPREDFTRTAVLWTGLLQHKLADGAYVDPEDVARCMIGVKLARDVHNPKRDNRVDMAGYALTLDRLETGQ